MSTNNVNVSLVFKHAEDGSIDVDATVQATHDAAFESIVKAVDTFVEESGKLETVINSVWETRLPTARNLKAASLAAYCMVEMGATDLEDLQDKIDAVMSARTDRFLKIQRGRNAGFHYKVRYSKEELAKLQKEENAA